jgi:hypothetical protein
MSETEPILKLEDGDRLLVTLLNLGRPRDIGGQKVKRIFWIALLSVVSINAFASDITLDLNVIGNNQKPILNVKTNLPAKAILMASLANPINQGGDGYFGQAKAAVSANRVVQFGPFLKTGDRLSPGIYQVTVTTVMAALQPEEVRPFFGVHGERLTGPQVSTLPGTSERLVSQTFQFKIDPDGSISNPPPNKHEAGDGLAGGSPDDIWQKVQSGGREISVMTNGRYYSTNPPLSTMERHSGYGFHTYIVANLPENTIVGAPQSVMHEIEGNCEMRHYHVLGHLFFAGKNRSGVAMHSMPPEDVERTLVPNSPFEKAFDMLCKIAEQNSVIGDSPSEIASAIPSPVKGVSPRLCAAVRYGNPNYADNMRALAKKAHLPDDYYNRYHEDLVKSLCQGNAKEVNSLIDNGDVSAGDAARIKQALTEASAPLTETSISTRSDAGRSYGYSKQKFIDMGLCMACADNVAQWYVQRPTSRCGMLAKHALEGDPDAGKELQTFPSYCTWEYK